MERRCARAGCPRAARPKGRYCGTTCRAADFKLRQRLGGMTPRERRQAQDREAKRAARANGVPRCDVRIQWERAVEELARHLDMEQRWAEPYSAVRARAAEILRPALPERLREHA